jgi:hypothetical protein
MGSVEQAHGADVISVVMAVYGVSDGGRGHARDGAKEVVTYGRWRVDDDDAVRAACDVLAACREAAEARCGVAEMVWCD